jgi:uncharacterized protein with PIN domain
VFGSVFAEMRFIVDTMLGDVARWLRIMGYDTRYSRSYGDRELLSEAILTGRILITRDKGLHAKARKASVRAVLLESTTIEERLAELSVKLGLELRVDPNTSRCPECNGVLERVNDKSIVRDRVPPLAYNTYDVFYACTVCGRVYWEGSHWDNIRRVVEISRGLAEEMRKAYRPRR